MRPDAADNWTECKAACVTVSLPCHHKLHICTGRLQLHCQSVILYAATPKLQFTIFRLAQHRRTQKCRPLHWQSKPLHAADKCCAGLAQATATRPTLSPRQLRGGRP